MTKSYTLEENEKATQIMIGTGDMLIWGDLITRQQVVLAAFMNTLAEDFVLVHDAKILFLAPTQQLPPIERSVAYVKLEEILFFFSMAGGETLPEESEVRRFENVDLVVGSFQIEGQILKSPITTMQNLLLVSKDAYLHFYRTTLRHVAKPWLGGIAAEVIQVRRDRMTLAVR